MSICTIYLKIKDEPIFPRTEERLRLQARELADYLGIGELEFDHRKDNYTFGWYAKGQLETDIKIIITYPNSLEEDDDWNEVVPDDRFNLYIAFSEDINKYEGKTTVEKYIERKKLFLNRVRNILRKKIPSKYQIIKENKGIINENFMNED